MNTPRPDKISWQAYEHKHKNRTTDWFWAVSIVAIGGIVLSIYFGNFLFALIIVLFTLTTFMLALRDPRMLTFELTRKGVRAGTVLYPYSLLDSFWVDDGEYDDHVIFRSKKPMSPYVILPFDSTVTDAELLRDFLLDYLDEEELEEPLYHKIMDRLGF